MHARDRRGGEDLVALPGLEPGLFALRGRRVNQLHHNARSDTRRRLFSPANFEQYTSLKPLAQSSWNHISLLEFSRLAPSLSRSTLNSLNRKSPSMPASWKGTYTFRRAAQPNLNDEGKSEWPTRKSIWNTASMVPSPKTNGKNSSKPTSNPGKKTVEPLLSRGSGGGGSESCTALGCPSTHPISGTALTGCSTVVERDGSTTVHCYYQPVARL
jgi:hypothetical protein